MIRLHKSERLFSVRYVLRI